MLEMLMAGGSGALPWKVVGVTEAEDVNANASVSFPGGVADGDAVFAFLYNRSGLGSGVAAPSGWTQIAYETEGTTSPIQQGYLYLLPSRNGQTAFQNSNFLAIAGCSILVVVLHPDGVDTAGMYHGLVIETDGAASAVNSYPTPPSLTTTTDRNQIFTFGATQGSNRIFSAPSGYDLLASTSGTSPAACCMSQSLQSVGGQITPPQITHDSTTDDWMAITVSLRTQPDPGRKILSGSFASATNDIVAQNYITASGTVTLSLEGGGSVSVEVSGGNSPSYRKNGGAWTSSPGTAVHGDVFEVREYTRAITKNTVVVDTVSLVFDSDVAGAKTFQVTNRRRVVIDGANTLQWTVPTGTTSVDIVAVGGGGGGGQCNINGSTYYGGGGGGGGAMSRKTQTVTAGVVFNLSPGGRGEENSGYGATGNAGGDTTVEYNSSVVVLAKGGAGGNGATTSAAGTGGAGGSSAAGTGTNKYSGGNGGNGTSSTNSSALCGGGGGGAGGYTGNGSAGANGSATTTANSSSAATGGAASGGGSNYGGGGVGCGGSGTSGAASSTGGKGGSPDDLFMGVDGAQSGATHAGGWTGGGGGGTSTATSATANGSYGYVRLSW